MQIKKSNRASLEDKKWTFLLVGFVCVLSVCYVALEWTKKDVQKWDIMDTEFLVEDQIEIQQTTQDVTPPPPPPPVQEVEVLNVVEDNVETEHIEIKSEEDKTEAVKIVAPIEEPEEEEEEEDVVFQIVESMPSFPGGEQALRKYLRDNVKYPQIAIENNIQGRVICEFVVNKDGSIGDVVVIRSGGDPSLDREAMRVLKQMPKWTPGKQRGKAVRVKYTVPVSFRLGS